MPNSLCENQRCYSPKDSVPNIINFIVILGIIFFFGFSKHTVLTEVFSGVPGYESSLVIILAQICTVPRCMHVHHSVYI